MIWSIVSKDEMDNYGTSNVFKFYREALGRDSIKLAVVDETDSLDFVYENDIVLLRTASKLLVDTIRKKGVKTTAEDFDVYSLADDKLQMNRFLLSKGILASQHRSLDNIKEGVVYFVKPRFGSDSKGVTESSICTSREDVVKQVTVINHTCNGNAVIENFIDGKEYTVSVLNIGGYIYCFPIEVDCSGTHGIQTQLGKSLFSECGLSLEYDERKELKALAERIFKELGIKHHARIDFRRDKDGKLYVIDVNLIPGLGPTGDLARCLLLSENYSYTDALKMVIASATKL